MFPFRFPVANGGALVQVVAAPVAASGVGVTAVKGSAFLLPPAAVAVAVFSATVSAGGRRKKGHGVKVVAAVSRPHVANGDTGGVGRSYRRGCGGDFLPLLVAIVVVVVVVVVVVEVKTSLFLLVVVPSLMLLLLVLSVETKVSVVVVAAEKELRPLFLLLQLLMQPPLMLNL